MRALSKLHHSNVATVVGAVMRDSVHGQVSLERGPGSRAALRFELAVSPPHERNVFN